MGIEHIHDTSDSDVQGRQVPGTRVVDLSKFSDRFVKHIDLTGGRDPEGPIGQRIVAAPHHVAAALGKLIGPQSVGG